MRLLTRQSKTIKWPRRDGCAIMNHICVEGIGWIVTHAVPIDDGRLFELRCSNSDREAMNERIEDVPRMSVDRPDGIGSSFGHTLSSRRDDISNCPVPTLGPVLIAALQSAAEFPQTIS